MLSLARLGKEEESEKITLEESPLREILESAVQACSLKASEKNIKINFICEENIKAKINPRLLEQAVVNLIDNVIKYSEPEKEVDVITKKSNGKVIINVSDHGCGIEKDHLSRIFERFYRVDRARSRDLGGTGLGLAIVKHIAQLHQGEVAVESTPGEGSVFSISLNTQLSMKDC